jgi:hypothetical protein
MSIKAESTGACVVLILVLVLWQCMHFIITITIPFRRFVSRDDVNNLQSLLDDAETEGQ